MARTEGAIFIPVPFFYNSKGTTRKFTKGPNSLIDNCCAASQPLFNSVYTPVSSTTTSSIHQNWPGMPLSEWEGIPDPPPDLSGVFSKPFRIDFQMVKGTMPARDLPIHTGGDPTQRGPLPAGGYYFPQIFWDEGEFYVDHPALKGWPSAYGGYAVVDKRLNITWGPKKGQKDYVLVKKETQESLFYNWFVAHTKYNKRYGGGNLKLPSSRKPPYTFYGDTRNWDWAAKGVGKLRWKLDKKSGRIAARLEYAENLHIASTDWAYKYGWDSRKERFSIFIQGMIETSHGKPVHGFEVGRGKLIAYRSIEQGEPGPKGDTPKVISSTKTVIFIARPFRVDFSFITGRIGRGAEYPYDVRWNPQGWQHCINGKLQTSVGHPSIPTIGCPTPGELAPWSGIDKKLCSAPGVGCFGELQ